MLSLYIYLHAYDKICMLLYGIYAKAVVDDSGRKQMAITHWGCSKTLFKLWWIFKRHSDAKTRDCPKIKKKKKKSYKISTYFYFKKISHMKR